EEAAVDDIPGQFSELLALDDTDYVTVEFHRVVTDRQRPLRERDLLTLELPCIPLAGVDDDLEDAACAPACREPHAGSGLSRGLPGLPEDPLPATLQRGDHELRPVLAVPVEDQ